MRPCGSCVRARAGAPAGRPARTAAAPRRRCARSPPTAAGRAARWRCPARPARAAARPAALPQHTQAGRAQHAERHHQQVAEHQHRHHAVRQLDRDARRAVEHAAFVVDADAAPQHEAFAEIVRAATTGPGTSGNRCRRPARRSWRWSSRPARSARTSKHQADPQQAAQLRRIACTRSVPGVARQASQVSSENVVRPPSRCAITTTGFSSQVTVHMPSTAWNTITISVTVARRARHRRSVQRTTPTSRMQLGRQRQHRRRRRSAARMYSGIDGADQRRAAR